MLRIHFIQNWFTSGDQAVEEALIDTPLYREFARLSVQADRLPDAITILRFRHLLERQGLAVQMFCAVNELLAAKGLVVKSGTAVDATIINAPSSTKNSSGQLPESGQEHGQAAHAVDAGQPVDAAQAPAAVRGMSASAAIRQEARAGGQFAAADGGTGCESDSAAITPHFLSTPARLRVSDADPTGLNSRQ